MALPDDALARRVAEVVAEAQARAQAGDRVLTAARRTQHRRDHAARIAQLQSEGLSRDAAEAQLEVDRLDEVGDGQSEDGEAQGDAGRCAQFLKELLDRVPAGLLPGAWSQQELGLHAQGMDAFAIRPMTFWHEVVDWMISEPGRPGEFASQARRAFAPLTGTASLYEALRAVGEAWGPAAAALQDEAQRRLFEVAAGRTSGTLVTHERPLPGTVEGLLRSGAAVLGQNEEGSNAAHLAAAAGNDVVFSALVRAAPVSILAVDHSGSTPLDRYQANDEPFRSNQAVKDAAEDATLACLAAFPETTARVLRGRPGTSALWQSLSRPVAQLIQSLGWLVEGEETAEGHLQAAGQLAWLREGEEVARLRHSKQRLCLLEAASGRTARELAALEPDELRLRVAQAEAKAQRNEEEAAARNAALEKEVARLRLQCRQQDGELLALRTGRGHGAAPDGAHGAAAAAPPDQPGDGHSRGPPGDAAEGPGEAAGAWRSERKVVEEIRKLRAVGSTPSEVAPELREGIAHMRASLAAAIDTMARDLYESEAHFVQELLQNADDNGYAEGAVPEVTFSLVRHGGQVAFIALNNERGFTEADVRAITDISRSSKDRLSGTTTGHKGVGWKSVFRVCNSPTVLSRGWRFRFGSRALDFLTPEWLPDSDYASLPAEVKEAHSEGQTVFFLPLADAESAASIEAEMVAMEGDPARILFLRRIRRLRLRDLSGREALLSAEGAAAGGGTERVACCTTRISDGVCSEARFRVREHEGVTIALPLEDRPRPQRVFASLPMRSVGFHFAANAPFHLTTGRADLHHSAENAALRDRISAAFLALCAESEEIAERALGYVGSPPAEPFWLAVRVDILAGLQGVRCVSTEDGQAEPRQCVLRGSTPIAKWIPGWLLKAACGLSFVSSDGGQRELANELGVREFDARDAVGCLGNVEAGRAGRYRWLRGMWAGGSRSRFFSDAYASLADALREDYSLLSEVQQLAIFPLAGNHLISSSEVDFGTLTSLYAAPCEGVPLEWQVPLVHVLNPELRLSEGAAGLLHILGVQPAQESTLEGLAVQRLMSIEAGHGLPDAGVWAALSVLRRCFVAGREPDVARWAELRGALLLPAADGGWLPAERLRPWSFLGVETKLPQGVIGHVRAFAGLERARALPGAAPGRECVAKPPPPPEMGGFGVGTCARQDWNLGWEVFLCGLGCAPLDPAQRFAAEAVEVTLELGGLLSSGQYWANAVESPRVFEYLERLLGTGAPRVRKEWVRQLPVVRSGHLQMSGGQRLLALQDVFARDTFHEIAGDLLEYVDAPADPRVLRLLQCLGVSTEVNRESLLKCLRQLKRRSAQDISVFADVYRKLGDTGLRSLGEEELVFVPGKGCLHAEDCTWLPFRDPLLQRCCRAQALSDHYGRFGEGVAAALQRWVRERPDSSASELCDALYQAVSCARPSMEGPDPRPVPEAEALEQLFDASLAVVRALAALCCDEDADVARQSAQVVFERFHGRRMIVLPNPPGGCRVLHVGEAFWSVHPSMKRQSFAEWALENHYADPLMYRFFVEVLCVRPELTFHECTLIPVLQQPDNLDRGSGELTQGIGSLRIDVSEMDGAGSGPFDVGAAVCRSYQRAQCCACQRDDWLDEGQRQPPKPQTRQPPQPRRWHRAAEVLGMPVYVADNNALPEDFNPGWHQGWFGMLPDLCPIFGLRPEQIALAFDASGRCVSEDQPLFLDYTKGRRLAQLAQERGRPPHPDSVLSFWMSEFAHALAHLGTGPVHDEAFLRVQAEILAAAMPAARQLLAESGAAAGALAGGVPSGGCRGAAPSSPGAAGGPSATSWPPRGGLDVGFPPPGRGPTPHSSASAPSGQPAQWAAQPRPAAWARGAASAAPKGGRSRGRGAKGGRW